jgi:hypothetical protein
MAPSVKLHPTLVQSFRIGFLGAFATLREATISFVVSVCLSVRMVQLGFHWAYFHEV